MPWQSSMQTHRELIQHAPEASLKPATRAPFARLGSLLMTRPRTVMTAPQENTPLVTARCTAQIVRQEDRTQAVVVAAMPLGVQARMPQRLRVAVVAKQVDLLDVRPSALRANQHQQDRFHLRIAQRVQQESTVKRDRHASTVQQENHPHSRVLQHRIAPPVKQGSTVMQDQHALTVQQAKHPQLRVLPRRTAPIAQQGNTLKTQATDEHAKTVLLAKGQWPALLHARAVQQGSTVVGDHHA